MAKAIHITLLMLAVFATDVHAADAPFPTRPLRVIVPSGGGGGTDVVARILAPKLAEQLGQQVVVDNRPGAASVIGVELAARAPRDGYTLVMVSAGFAINPSFMQKIPYDPIKDFSAIVHAASTANVLVVHPSLSVTSVKELVALARSKPGQISYASAGLGSSPHLSMELLRLLSQMELVHVPYKGSGPATIDVLGGRVPLMFPSLPTAIPHLKSGRLRALGVSTPRRSSIAPDVPALAETYPGYEATQWFGLLAPAGTPSPVIARVHRAAMAALTSPDVIKLLADQGAEAAGGSSRDFATFIAREKQRWAEVIARAGIAPQ